MIRYFLTNMYLDEEATEDDEASLSRVEFDLGSAPVLPNVGDFVGKFPDESVTVYTIVKRMFTYARDREIVYCQVTLVCEKIASKQLSDALKLSAAGVPIIDPARAQAAH